MALKPVGYTITTEHEGKRQMPGGYVVWWDRDTHSIADYFPNANPPRRERVSATEAVATHVAFMGDSENKPQALALYAEADVQLLAKQRDELLLMLEQIIGACDRCVEDDNISLIDEFTEEMEQAARATIARVKAAEA